MNKYKSFVKFLWSSFLCLLFLYLFWVLSSKVWDIHMQFEETEMENGKVAIKQAVNTAIESCLSNVRTTDSGKLDCKYDYGTLDYVSLTFNVTIQKVATGISRCIPFSSSLQCHNPKGECHTIILFLVGWWFGSRHSILFSIVFFGVILFVCFVMYPVVMSFTSSISELARHSEYNEYRHKKFDYGDNYNVDVPIHRKPTFSVDTEEKINKLELDEIARKRELDAIANRMNYNSSLHDRYVNMAKQNSL